MRPQPNEIWQFTSSDGYISVWLIIAPQEGKLIYNTFPPDRSATRIGRTSNLKYDLRTQWKKLSKQEYHKMCAKAL